MSTAGSTAGGQAGAAGQAPLDAVLRAPDDDKPRLNYAAWCDGQLTPAIKARGVFIRAQIDLVRLRGTGTWDAQHRSGHAADNARREHGDAWDTALRAMVASVLYDRGFVELVRTSATVFLERGAEMRRLAPIRHLDLSGVGEAGRGLWSSGALVGIRSISMDRAGLTDDLVGALAESAHLGDLRWLSIQDNGLGAKSGEALARSKGLPRLMYANFRGNPYDPTNQFSHDGEIVGSVWLPDEGRRLERKHGPLAWLHWVGQTFADLVPDRFRV